MEAEFSLIDVFSDRPFGGNQLAVFPRAEGLSDEVMQQLAREFNFAESTFVLPSSDPACTHRVRIFTPRTELPFAGHATVGTAAVLASRNPGSSQFLFEEGIGPVTVIADGPAWRLVLPSPEYETSPQPPSAVPVARALSLPETAVVRCWFAGVGLRFCFVQLTGQDMVDRATLDTSAWRVGLADGWSPHLYVFAGDFRDGQRLYSRFFAPAIGVAEDPATGSACVTLVASLADGSPQVDGSFHAGPLPRWPPGAARVAGDDLLQADSQPGSLGAQVQTASAVVSERRCRAAALGMAMPSRAGWRMARRAVFATADAVAARGRTSPSWPLTPGQAAAAGIVA